MIHVNIFLLCYLNEINWTDVFAQIPLVGQFALGPFICIVVCKFCVASPLCVNTCPYKCTMLSTNFNPFQEL
jgi:hypothetical protein